MRSADTACRATPDPRAARSSTTSTFTSPPDAGDPGPLAPEGLSRQPAGAGRHRSRHRAGRVRGSHRAQRRREVHTAPLPERSGHADSGRGRGARPDGHRRLLRVAAPPPGRHRVRVPAVQSPPPAHRAGERGAGPPRPYLALAIAGRVGRGDTLAGGQQRRVPTPPPLVQPPTVLRAEEPMASLDPALAHTVMELL